MVKLDPESIAYSSPHWLGSLFCIAVNTGVPDRVDWRSIQPRLRIAIHYAEIPSPSCMKTKLSASVST